MATTEALQKDLEARVDEARRLLQHWQSWDAEYEALKEELDGLDETASPATLRATAERCEGSLLNKKEIGDILHDTQGRLRDRLQINSSLARRIEYVGQNVIAARKRLEAAESRLDESVAPTRGELDGLPLTEIVEELDDDGNVISSSTTTPGQAVPALLEVLRENGIAETDSTEKTNQEKLRDGSNSQHSDAEVSSTEREQAEKASNASTQAQLRASEDPALRESKKPTNTSSEPKAFEESDARVEGLDDLPKSQDIPSKPLNETAEEARLRQEMVRYGLEEVGTVVAEMDLDDDSDDLDDLESQESGSDVEEDQFGRSIRMEIDDEYRRQMLELQNRLNGPSMVNAGPNHELAKTVNSSQSNENSQTQANPKDNISSSSKGPSSKPKRAVHFAPSLDVQEAPTASSPELIRESAPISTTISERTTRPPGETQAKEPSFKALSTSKPQSRPEKGEDESPRSGRTQSGIVNGPLAGPGALQSLRKPQNMPTSAHPGLADLLKSPSEQHQPMGPAGKTHADVVERKTSKSDADRGRDDMEDLMHKQQVAREYYQARNRIIQQQGGFLPDEDERELELPVDDQGRKMSRFKAARISQHRRP